VQAYDLLYYRLSQTDGDGHHVVLGIRTVYPEGNANSDVTAYPNPCSNRLHLSFTTDMKKTIPTICCFNVLGEKMNVDVKEEEQGFYLTTDAWPQGLFSLMIQLEEKILFVKVYKE
jgi:hypothetical protein